MHYIIPLLLGLALPLGLFFNHQQNEELGAFSDPFVSVQLATSPSNGNCLTTDGTNNAWGSCGTGGGGGGGFPVYFQNGGATLNVATTTVNLTSNSFAVVENPADTLTVRVATTTLGLLTTNVSEGSNLYYTDARVSSYMSASSTYSNLISFYTTPSTRITDGNGLTWSGNTLNFDGGNTPSGDLGGTWASPTIDDLFLLNTGDVGTGNYDFGGATFFEIVNGASPTCDDPGEVCHDTTGNQFVVDDYIVPLSDQRIWGVTIASTSAGFISEGLVPTPANLDGYTITRIQCHVTGGTSKVIAIEDASANSSEDITCATTNTTDDGSITNATYTASELQYIDFGATSGSVNYVTISVFGNYTRE